MQIYYFYCISSKRLPKKLNTSVLRPCNFLHCILFHLHNEKGIRPMMGPERSTLMQYFLSFGWNQHTSGHDISDSSLNPVVVVDRSLGGSHDISVVNCNRKLYLY